MTATPIPRTLVLDLFRRHGRFRAAREAAGPHADRHARHAARAARRSDRRRSAAPSPAGARAYWVCPLVEESEALDVAAAEERAAALRAVFRRRGRAGARPHEGADKDAAMERFQRGDTESAGRDHGGRSRRRRAGSDDHGDRARRALRPRATASVARPGRARRRRARPACCSTRGRSARRARARLEILRETEDGFRIAEEDLRLRGEGDVLGARQAGAPGFRLARLEVHGALLRLARERRPRRRWRRASGSRRREPRPAAAALPFRARRGGAADGGGVTTAPKVGQTRPRLFDSRRRSGSRRRKRSRPVAASDPSRSRLCPSGSSSPSSTSR